MRTSPRASRHHARGNDLPSNQGTHGGWGLPLHEPAGIIVGQARRLRAVVGDERSTKAERSGGSVCRVRSWGWQFFESSRMGLRL